MAALGAGLGIAEAEFSFVGLGLVVLGFLGLVAVVAAGGLTEPLRARDRTTRRALAGVAALLVLGTFVWAPVWYASGPWLAASHWLTRGAALAAAATAAPALSTSRPLWRVSLALAAAGGAAMILGAPVPLIDVWYLLQQSTEGLLAGQDAYRQVWVGSPGLTDVYPYLPWTSVLLVPAQLLTADVRFGLLAASVLAAALVRRVGGPALPVLVPLLVVLAPRTPWTWQQAWTEPLLVAALAAMVLAVRSGRADLAVLAFAAALASKQHVALLVPLAAAWPAFGVRRAAASAGLAAAAVLPWFLADPRAMIDDAVRYNLALPVLERGLDLPALLLRSGIEMSFLPMLVALLGAYLLCLLRLPRDAAGFCLGGALVLWTLDLLNKQSFYNHYTLPLGLVVLAIAASGPALAQGRAEPARSRIRAARSARE